MYLFDPDNSGPIPNNSIIVTDNFGQMPRLQCISGSKSPNVGQWIAPSGQDATYRTSDPFDVVMGDENDPGYLDISLHPGQFITFNDQGVYTCHIPDETGVVCSVFVGIYLPTLTSKTYIYIHTCAYIVLQSFIMHSFSAPVSIMSLEERSDAEFTLNCASVGSPATNVTWIKDDDVITSNDTFEVFQYLQDSLLARYDNLLKVYLEPSEVVGTYTCSVDNSVSVPAVQTLAIQGQLSVHTKKSNLFTNIQFLCMHAGLMTIGNTIVRVGQNATITCTSDLNVQTVEWMFNDDVVASSSSQEVDLTFSPVVDYLHNREYICRTATSYGTLERRVTITVESKCV